MAIYGIFTGCLVFVVKDIAILICFQLHSIMPIMSIDKM